MKRHDWKKLIEEPVSRAAQDRMFAAADSFLEENLAASSSSRIWQDLVEEPVSREARDRTFRAADRFIDEHLAPAPAPSWASRLFGPGMAFTFAGAAAAVAIFFLISVPKDGRMPEAVPETARIEPELIQNIDLLLELDTLEHWNPDKQAQGTYQWKKERS